MSYGSEAAFDSVSLRKRLESAFTCSSQSYGFYYGNDRPLWSGEFGENLRQVFDIVPFFCNSNDEETPASDSDASATEPNSPTEPSDGQ